MSKKLVKGKDKNYNSFSQDLSYFIRLKINEKGYNITQFAQKLNVNPSTVSRWITWKSEERIVPSFNMLIRIMKVLNLNNEEKEELFRRANIVEFPNFENLFPPEPEYLQYLLNDADRNLYEDKLNQAKFYYNLVITSLEEYFRIKNGIMKPFVKIYLHGCSGISYLNLILEEKELRENLLRMKGYIGKKNFPNYYFFYRYIKFITLYSINMNKYFFSYLENLEKEIIRYYKEDYNQPLYIHNMEILLEHIKKYKALTLGPTLEAENILYSAFKKLCDIKSFGAKIAILLTWGRLISIKDFYRGISLLEEALKICKREQDEFEKIGVWREQNRNLISNLPLQVMILLSLADLFLNKKDLASAKYFAQEILIIANKINLIKQKEYVERILNIK